MSQVCRCGAETTKLRQVWVNGEVQDEFCPTCRPAEFERQRDPSDKKLWMGWEYDPRYTKSRDPDGQTRMTPSDSVLQDLENMAMKRSEEELRSEDAQRVKRESQRTAPMSADELKAALAYAKDVAGAIEEHHEKKHATG